MLRHYVNGYEGITGPNMVDIKETSSLEVSPHSTRRPSLRLLLRLTILSLLAILAVIAYETVKPLPKPEAVRRVEALNTAKSPELNLDWKKLETAITPLVADPASLPANLRVECDDWNGK